MWGNVKIMDFSNGGGRQFSGFSDCDFIGSGGNQQNAFREL